MTARFWHECRNTGADFRNRLTPSGWGGGFPIPARVTPRGSR
jgi:hypothetical protein